MHARWLQVATPPHSYPCTLVRSLLQPVFILLFKMSRYVEHSLYPGEEHSPSIVDMSVHATPFSSHVQCAIAWSRSIWIETTSGSGLGFSPDRVNVHSMWMCSIQIQSSSRCPVWTGLYLSLYSDCYSVDLCFMNCKLLSVLIILLLLCWFSSVVNIICSKTDTTTSSLDTTTSSLVNWARVDLETFRIKIVSAGYMILLKCGCLLLYN